MIHAAITAVALSCCTTITLAETTNRLSDGETSIDFKGGSVAQYIHEVADGFKAVDQDPNIILLPGTEGVVLPPLSLRVADPGDAFAAIADYVYTTEDGTQISVDFETVGVESSIFRISGQEWRPSSRSRTPSRVASPVESTDEPSVSILRVPGDHMESVVALAEKVLELAGLSGKTSLVPLPKDDLLLVSSTETGQILIGEIVFEVIRPKRKKSDDDVQSRRPSAPATENRQGARAELSALARKKSDGSLDPDQRKDVDERFKKALERLRRTN